MIIFTEAVREPDGRFHLGLCCSTPLILLVWTVLRTGPVDGETVTIMVGRCERQKKRSHHKRQCES